MKHKLFYILPVLAVLFGFTACSSDDDITDIGQNTELTGDNVIVKAGIGANSVFTRSNPIGTTADQAKFNEGDIILIYDEAQKFSVYKLDAQGAWNFYNPTVPGTSKTYYYDCTPMKWDANQKTFCAAYPVGDSRWDGAQRKNWYQGDDRYYSEQFKNQSTLNNLTLSDVMYAKATVEKPENHTINLKFERQTARVIVKLKYNNQFDNLNPTVGNLQIYGVDVLSSWGNSGWYPFTPYYNSANDEYVVLLFPMTADASKQFMGLTINHDPDADEKKSTDLTLTGAPALEKGKSYTFNVTVGKKGLTIESVTVSDWTDGGALPDGEATQQ